MTTRFQAPKGVHDWTPDEQPLYRWIEQTMRETVARAGFRPIDLPLFEQTELFARGVGTGTDIVEKEMYTFESRGGESLTLRPEFTAGVARAYVEHGMKDWPQPVKLFAIGPLFRYEQPGKGRYRQHVQMSVETLGELDPAVDAEMIKLAVDIYRALGVEGLDFKINSIGCPDCRPAYVRDVLVPWLEARRDRLGETDRQRLKQNPLRVLDTKDTKVRAMLAEVPLLTDHLCDDCRAHFAGLQHHLDLLDIAYESDPLLVRGFDYYTKTVFEIQSPALESANNAVGGGGRYDGLVELVGGDPTPGMGMGLGLERIALLLGELGIQPPALPTTDLYAVWFDGTTKEAAFVEVARLREAGIGAEMAFAEGRRSFKSQMRAADRSPARYTLIFGKDELARGEVGVKEMASGEQTSVPREGLVDWLQVRLAAGSG